MQKTGFQMLNDNEIVTSVQEESDPVDDEADEDEDNKYSDAFSVLETAVKRDQGADSNPEATEELKCRKSVTCKTCRGLPSSRWWGAGSGVSSFDYGSVLQEGLRLVVGQSLYVGMSGRLETRCQRHHLNVIRKRPVIIHPVLILLRVTVNTVGSLVVRTSDSRPEGLGSMPDTTKDPPSTHGFPCRNCGGGDRGGVAIYRPFGEFRRAKIALSPVWCSRPTTGVPLAHATMNFVGLDLTTSDRWHQKTTTTNFV
ncbi:hypothetical protein TNCV_4814251 [Trichonephila clavipes]|nr:hypothetical protein TNCV_4814251 [Trichonephila clavipes]